MSWPDSDINAICSRDDLSRFLGRLAERIAGDDPVLENRISERMVEAASRWVLDMDGYYGNMGQQMPENPTWSMIADIFYAAMIYE